MTILVISFVAGVLTVLAPCILPLLPVIVGSSVSGGPEKIKAVVVTISLGVSVILFTLLLKVSSIFINIPSNVWSYISGGIIIILAIVTLFPSIWDKFKLVGKANRESNKILAVGYKKDSIWGDIIIGASLGPVFSTCSPTYFFILATVLPLSPIVGFIDLLAYTIGLCLALLVISFLGQKIIEKLGIASNPNGWLKKTLGILFLVVGVAVFFGYDKVFETNLLNSGIFDITKVEQVLLQNISSPKSEIPVLENSISTSTEIQKQTTKSTSRYIPTLKERQMAKAQLYKKSPEITNPSGFVNTDGKPITIAEFKGKKVVLIDIWTYSCINCQRTLPYIKSWYDKYHDQGLEIIGIHTPEFSFEKLQKNVEEATRRDNVRYPVVLDNDYSTWNAFGNNYWPRKYLIDLDGFIIYDHIGEGGYDETEKMIQKALKERAEILDDSTTISTDITKPKDVISLETGKINSPETYFGAFRNEYLGNGYQFTTGEQALTIPKSISRNILYLGGKWNFEKEYAETRENNSSVVFKYSAKNVYMVMSSPNQTNIEVWIDGKKTKILSVKDEMLYTLVEGVDYEVHTLELKIEKSGLKAFTFTFG